MKQQTFILKVTLQVYLKFKSTIHMSGFESCVQIILCKSATKWIKLHDISINPYKSDIDVLITVKIL